VLGVLEVIGAELEAALDGMVPRCEVCGSTFSATDVVLVQGHVRKHKDCFLSGKPCHESSFDPKAAARSVPSTLTIRVLVGAGAAKKPITFFLLCDLVNAQAPQQEQTKAMETAVHKMANAGPCDFRFVPDPNARAGAKRKLPAGATAGDATSMFEVELATNESTGIVGGKYCGRAVLWVGGIVLERCPCCRCSHCSLLMLLLAALSCSLLSLDSLFCHSLYRAAAPSVRPHR
jgi:hypothetical protein